MYYLNSKYPVEGKKFSLINRYDAPQSPSSKGTSREDASKYGPFRKFKKQLPKHNSRH